MKKPALPVLSALLLAALSAPAVTLLSPSDAIIGGARVGANFEEGTVGTAGGLNNWPSAEPPADLINGLIGGGGEKYLNFAELDTGFIVTPGAATGGLPSIIESMELWVANDAAVRDPASYELYGTNASILGGGPFSLADFTLIQQGGLALPALRDTVVDTTGNSQVVAITTADAYTTYMLVFPTVNDAAAANSMQLSEVQFTGTVVPEPTVSLLAGLGGLLLLRRRR